MQLLKNLTFQAIPFVVAAADGRILRIGSCPAEMVDLQSQPGEHAFAGTADQLRQYIDVEAAAVLDRPTIAPVVSGLTISNLPPGCIAITEEQEFPVVDGAITLDYELPGTYLVTLRAWPWLDATVSVVQP